MVFARSRAEWIINIAVLFVRSVMRTNGKPGFCKGGVEVSAEQCTLKQVNDYIDPQVVYARQPGMYITVVLLHNSAYT
jgi:hypothetical protein